MRASSPRQRVGCARLASVATAAMLMLTAYPARAEKLLELPRIDGTPPMFLDVESAVLDGSKVTINTKSTDDPPIFHNAAYKIVRLSLDCAAETWKILEILTYDSSGKIINTNIVGMSGTAPGKVGTSGHIATIKTIVCDPRVQNGIRAHATGQ